jgi:hypothetical protein
MLTTAGRVARKILAVGGWAPLAIFVFHVIMLFVLRAYRYWPRADIQMHFLGGAAMAWFFSGVYRAMPRPAARSSRVVLLELVWIGSLTTTMAVLWEFAEFLWDRAYGTNMQVDLPNTMQDMAVGMAGALFVMALRARQMRLGSTDVRAVVADWASGSPD